MPPTSSMKFAITLPTILLYQKLPKMSRGFLAFYSVHLAVTGGCLGAVTIHLSYDKALTHGFFIFVTPQLSGASQVSTDSEKAL